MSKPSFIKRIFSLGRSEETAEAATATEAAASGETLAASASGEAAAQPSITEILFRRSGPPPTEGEETVTEESRAVVQEKTGERKISKKEETAQKISEGFDNLSGLLKTIGEKLETGNERKGALQDSIEGLPEVLESIPETNRAQIEFLNTISKQLDLSNSRSGEIMEQFKALPAILESIPASQEQHARQLRQISRMLSDTAGNQLDFMKEAEERQSEALESFQSAQKRSLNLFHNAQQESLAAYQKSQDAQRKDMTRMVENSHRSLTRVLVICSAIAGAAVVGVAAMFFLT
jgi:hypothetical protein